MNCEICPFNNQVKVFGEGTRFTMEMKKVPSLENGKKVYIEKEVKVYDREGQYDVVGVGMAPAREECYRGRPFVGASGQILRQTLQQMGVNDYYLTNVFPCSITDENLTLPALDACSTRERIVEEILARKPKLTIALGDLPLHILCDTDYTITEVEGRILPSKVGPLLPLVHPAFYWRNPEKFFDFIECARSGIRWLNGTYTQCCEPTSTVVDKDNWQEVLNTLDKYEDIAVDLETTGFAAYGWDPDHILEMGLSANEEHAYIVPAELIQEFKPLLEKKKGIYWNAQFDAAFLKGIGINAKVDYDGMLAHYSLDERPYSHGLKKVAKTYLGADNWEKELDKYIPKRMKKSVSYEVVPQEIRYKYLAKDVTRTFQLKHAMSQYINKKVFDSLLMPACRMFIEIENRGLRINPVLMMSLDNILDEDCQKLEKEIHDLVGRWLNPNSTKEVPEYLYNELGLPMDPHFGFSSSKQALEGIKDLPVVQKIITYRQTAKMKGTYIEGFAKFVDRNYRIHPSIKIHGSETGRLSSEHPSIMNIKTNSKLKEMFLADEDSVLLYGDIKGNELRWYGIVAQDPVILGLLKEGRDPHHELGLVAFGTDELSRKYRMDVKSGFFGTVYQRGRDSMARQFGLERVDAIIAAIRQMVPEAPKYYSRIEQLVKTQGYLESYFGRKRRFGLMPPEFKKHMLREAVNFPIQSPGSDTMLYSMLHLWENKDKWGIWPFWPVHDSITMQAPDARLAKEMKKILEKFSYELVEGQCPFVWDMKSGPNWAFVEEEE